MALPYPMDQLRPSHPPAPSVSASNGPPTKKIKRTNFPNWEEPPAAKRSSLTPLTPVSAPGSSVSPSLVGSGRLAASRAVQAAQKQWQDQQAAAASEPAPVVIDDSDSEYFTSDSTASDNGEYEEDSGHSHERNHIFQPRPSSKSSTGRSDSHVARNHTVEQYGTRQPWKEIFSNQPKPTPGTMSGTRASVSAPSSTPQPRNTSSAPEGQPQHRATLPMQEPAKHLALGHISATKPHLSEAEEREKEAAEAETYQGSKHLTPNELEAKIRDSLNSPQSRDTNGLDGAIARLRESVGLNGQLHTTADGRLYCQLNLPNDKMLYSGILPIPTNYTLHSDQDNPIICPVRECQKIGATIASLMGHFGALHSKTKFNDNLDGTISAVAPYSNNHGTTSPGIIVSRGPPPRGAAPPAQPSKSAYTQRMAAAKKLESVTPDTEPKNLKRASRQSTVANATPSGSSTLSADDTDPIRYLRSIIDINQETPVRSDVAELVRYPRRRSLPRGWIAHHRGTVLSHAHYACAIAYLVGHEIQRDGKCDAPIWSTSRLSDLCIRLPDNLSEQARAAFCKLQTCVGCRYYSILQRRPNVCTWSVGRQRDTPSEGRTESGDVDMADVTRDSSVEESVVPQAQHRGRRSSRQVQVESRRAAPDSSLRKSSLRYSTAFSESSAAESNETQLEMEDWEFAPGRLLNKKEPAQTFSNSYLTSREPVTVSDDIGFNVAVLSSGSTVHLAVEETKLRTCSVATGKVKVKIGGTEFKIGPHGMFKVMPGESCTIENRHYVDAYIHCTTVDHYEV